MSVGRVVVFGATGNVGTAVMRHLASDESIDEVVGVARRLPADDIGGVRWRAADIASDDLRPVVAGADVVVNLAWLLRPERDEERLRAVNVGGMRRLLDAIAHEGVGALVVASSVGTYAPGPKDRAVDEGWSNAGVPSCLYSRHKRDVERLLDTAEEEQPDLRIVRMRKALVFQHSAASEIARLFLGPLVPLGAFRRRFIPVVPANDRLRFQVVHSDDAAEAYRAAVTGDVRGPFNIATEPVIDGDVLARALEARTVPVPGWLMRAGADVTWRLRLQPTHPGWVDMALGVPIMDTGRARREMGWVPRTDAVAALRQLLDGFVEHAGAATAPLTPRGDGPIHDIAEDQRG